MTSKHQSKQTVDYKQPCIVTPKQKTGWTLASIFCECEWYK